MTKSYFTLLLLFITSLFIAQEIDVQGKNVTIPIGSTSPSRNNNTIFGTQVTYAGSITKTFSITNTGDVVLTVYGVVSTQTNFVVSSFPTTTIAPYGSASFAVTFDPSVVGTTNGTIQVLSDDWDEGVYEFRVTGTGLTSRSVRWVNNAGATRPTSVTVNGVSYATINATYTTVQAALSAASTNDIIYVTNGRYKNPSEPSSTNCNYVANLSPDPNLYITFGFSSNLLITSETGDYATSSARLVGYSFNFNYPFQNDLTIQGLTLDSIRQNAFYNTNNSVSNRVSDVSILRNKITNVRGHGVKTDSWGAGTLDRGMWEIIGNYFENIGYYQSGVCTGTLNTSAIWMAEAGSSCEIRDNTIINPKWAGILCDGFGNPNGSINGAVSIQGNKIYNTGNAGIQIGWSSSGNGLLQTPRNAIITNNYIENANTSSVTGVGAITMLSSNLAGVKVMYNQVNNSWNGLVVNIAGWVNRPDTADCRFNNFCNIKAGSYGFVHQTGIAPNVLANVSDNARLYKLRNNYWGASSGPTSTLNPGGTGAAIFRSPLATSGGSLYSFNNMQVIPFSTSAFTLPITSPGTVQGSTLVCSGVTQTYSVAPVAGATSYTWSLPGGWSGTSTTNVISVTTTTNSGNISVYCVNACGNSATSTRSITSSGSAPGPASAITGSTTICAGSTNTYTTALVAGATSYTWTLPSGWTGTSTTNTISTTSSTNSGLVSVAAINLCGVSAASTLSVSVDSNPTITVNSGSLCSGNSFTINPSGANTYTITGGSFIVSPTILTSYSITGTSSLGCAGSNTAVSTIGIYPALNTSTGVTNVICNGGSTGSATISASGGQTPYTYLWSTAQTTSVISSLNAGVRSVTVSDFNGCTSSKSITVTQPAVLIVSSSSFSNSTGSNGSAGVVVSGGTGAYSYTWSPGNPTGQGTASITGLAGGNYTCLIKDVNNCSVTATFTISSIAPAAALDFDGINDYVTTPITTTSFSNGLITLEAWVNSTANSSFASIIKNWGFTQAGAFHLGTTSGGNNLEIFITQSNSVVVSCSDPATITPGTWYHVAAVADGSNLKLYKNGIQVATTTYNGSLYTGFPHTFIGAKPNDTGTNAASFWNGKLDEVRVWNRALCQAEIQNNMNAEIATTGTSLIANYHFNQGFASANNPTVTSLIDASGGGNNGTLTNFGLTGTTSNWIAPGAVTSGSIVSAFSSTLSTTITSSNVSCNSGSNGSATVTATGGPPYTYSWMPSGGTASIATGLTAGNYTVRVTNTCGTFTNATVNISQPTALITSTAITNVLCFGNSTGSATVTASGGTSPYTYLWSSAQTTSVISSLNVGARTVTVTDANACTNTISINITQPTAVSSTTNVSHISCFGNSTGAATVTASGGTSPYTYLWSSAQTTSVITALNAGVRTVTITDANSCTATAAVTNTQPASGLSISSSSITNTSVHSSSTGAVGISVTGGSSPYTYTWTPGTLTGNGTATITNLGMGVYTVLITDANTCTLTNNYTVYAPAEALHFDGVNDRVSATQTINASSGTWEAWVKKANWAAHNDDRLFGNGINFGTTNSFYVSLHPIVGFHFRVGGAGDANNFFTSSLATQTLASNSWHHLAATWNRVGGVTTCNLYLDGVALANSSAAITIPVNTGTVYFGGGGDPANPYFGPGEMDEVRIWSRALCQSEIVHNMNAEVNGPLTGLLNTYHANQGIGGANNSTITTLTDASGNANTGTLANFALNGSTSNWITPGAVVAGSTVSAFSSSISANVVGTTSVTCNGLSNGSATVSATGDAPFTYTWFPAGGSAATATNLPTGDYTVSITNACGTNTQVFLTIIQPSAINLTTTASSSSICSGNSVTLTANATGGTGTLTYTWTGGPNTNSYVLSPSVTSTYSVNVRDVNNCLVSNTITQIVAPSPIISINSGTICSGTIFTLIPSGADSYTFSSGAATLTPLSNTTVSVIGSSSLSCISTNTAISTITVYSLPTISVNSGSICSGNSFTINASGANTYTYSGGSAVLTPTASVSISVTGTSSLGCLSSNTAVSNVTVNTTPTLSVNSGSICSGNSFTLLPSGASTYTYSGGSSIVTPTSTSSYTVTGTSAQGCTATSVVSNVTVNITPTLSVNSGSICSGQSFTINPTGASLFTVSGGATVVSPTITTSYTITGGSTAGCPASNTVVSAVTVNTLPIISVNSGSICSGTSFTLSPSGANTYTYQGGSAIVSPTTTNSYTVIGSNADGCVSASSAISNVTVFALPTLSLSGGSICPGNSFTLSPTGAATYTYLNGGPVVTPGSTTSYSVTGTSAEGCPASNTISAVVTVTNTLIVSITGSAAICSGLSTTLTGNGASTYSWSTGVTTNTVVLTPSVNTTYTVYGVSGTCSNNAVVTVSVYTTPTISIAGSNTLCSGNSIGLTASGANTYSWSTSATTNTINVSPTSDISYSVVGTTTDGCAASATQAITVYSVPVISVNSGSICSGNSFTLLPSGASTYTYSGGSSIVTPTSTSSYTVTGTSAQGCTATPVVSNVTVNITPTLSVNSGSICSGQSFTINPTGASLFTVSGGATVVSPTITTSYTITGGSTAGCPASNTVVSAVTVNTLPIISVNSGSICSSTSFTLNPSGANTYTYQGGSAIVSPTTTSSYTVIGSNADGCISASSAISNVTVFALPTLSLSGGSICPGNSFTLSPTGAATYTYLNGGPVVTPGSTTSYSVTGTSAEGCPASNTISAVVTVTNTLIVSITGSAAICSGLSTTLTGNGASTYSWSTGVTTNTVVLTPSVNTTYTVYGVSGTCSNNAVVTVSVYTTPTISIAGSSTLCSGNSIGLTASGANTYSWSTSATTNTINVSPTADISYSVVGTTTDGCAASATQAITVYSVPVISVGSGSICSGNSFTLSPSGALTYTYSSGSAVVTPTSTSSYTVTGTSAQGCTATPVVSNVTVNITPTLSVNSGSICSGQSFTINPTGASLFTVSGGTTVVSPTVTTNYTVTGGSTAGCPASNTVVSAVTVNTLPIISVNSGSICSGTSFTLNPSGANTYTYQGGSAIVSPTTTSSYTVIGSNADGCVSASSAISNVTVFALPTLSLSGGSICPGNSFTLSPTGAATYTYLNGGPVVTPGSTTSYSVTGTSAEGCPASNTISAVVTVTNTLLVGISGTSSLCTGNSIILTGNGASTYSWSTGITTNTISLSPSVNTSYTVYGVSGTCSNNAVVTVSVYTTPTISIAGSNTLCSGNSIGLTASGANTYLWSTSATTITINVSPTSDISYSVVGTTTDGCAASATQAITVYSVPVISVNSGSICSGNSFTLLPSGASTYTYSGGSSIVTPTSTSSYTVTGTSVEGCIALAAVSNVTVNVTPTVAALNGTICAGDVFTISPSGAFTYTYSSGNSTVAPSSNQSYSVIGSSSLGCISSNTAVVAITVNTLPIISASNGTICNGSSYTIIPSGANSYSISGGNFTVSPTSNTAYTITGTGSNGCVNSIGSVMQVTVYALPTLSLTGGSICPGNAFTLSPTGAATYTYLNGGPVVSPAVTTTYSVTGTSAEGCAATNTISAIVTVTNTLSMSITGSTVICSGQTATLTGNGATTYSWNTTSTSQSITVNPLVNTTYTVYGVSGTCSNNAVVTVTVNTTPTLAIAGNNTLCAGSSVNYTVSGADTYSWSTNSTNSIITVNPPATSSYSVIGTTTSGCTNTAVVNSTVFVLPTITVNSGSICSGNVFTLVPTGAQTYTFSSGSATVSPLVFTTYTVVGTSTDGCVGSAAISSVVINPNPTITVNSGTLCSGLQFIINPSGADIYTFSSGSSTVNPTITTNYSVTGTSSLGCAASNTAISTVTVFANPSISISVSSSSVCSGASATLTASGAVTYSWSTTSTSSIVVVTPSALTVYSVTGTDALGCNNSSNQTIGLFNASSLTLTSTSNSICAGTSATLNAAGATTYTWSNGDNTQATVVTPSATTTYSVNALDINNCSSSSTISIAFNALPEVLATASQTGVCLGLSSILTASGASTYIWNTGSTSNTISVTPSVTSQFTVTGTSLEGCSASRTIAITSFPLPTVNIGPDVEVGIGALLQLNPTQSLAVSFTWSPSDYLSNVNIINPTSVPMSDISYILKVSSVNGCIASDSVNVKLLRELIISNYMSPNNDGNNDTWKVNLPVLIKAYTVIIIDSYGQEVYRKASDYNNEFDGNKNGDPLPDGAYYYFIKDGDTVKYSGSITLTK